jgi:hypothetical protein
LNNRRPREKGLVHWSWVVWSALLVAVVLLVVAPRLGLMPRSGARRPVNLIDPRQELVVAGSPGWDYHRTFEADLDGDNRPETIEILARVQREPGRDNDYQWDDGQPWQVYVRDGDQLTHVYARWVQLGRLSVYVTDELRPRLIIAESQGAGYALYAVEYQGPDRFKATMMTDFPVRDGA